jgi:hypothetical protein
MIDGSMARLLADIEEHARRELQSDRHAATLAQLGWPQGLVLPEFIPDVAVCLLELTLAALGSSAEGVLADRRAEVVAGIADDALDAALRGLRRARALAPPASEG